MNNFTTNMKKKIFLTLIIILSIICFISFKKINMSYHNENKITNKRTENKLFVTGLKINKKNASYNSLNSTFYINGKDEEINTITVFSPYKTRYILKKIDSNNYEILIYSNKYYTYANISFCTIPTLNISTFNQIISREYLSKNGTSIFNNNLIGETEKKVFLNLYDFDFVKHNSYENNLITQGIVRIRGASSRAYLKKSYKIKIKNDTSILGLSKDNDFILDALYIDKSKVRNKLSSDIWNSINDNQKINNDLKSEFVDLYVDNNYYGLYTMKNNVDTHVTNIKEEGIIIKSIDHNNSVLENNLITNDYSIIDNSFLNMEIKKYNKESFNNFIEKMNLYYKEDKNYNIIEKIFDMDNYINYKVFVALISGTDNLSKNQYYSMVDSKSKILITPWDMDLTWGLFWDDYSSLNSMFKMQSSIDIDWMNENITTDMDEKTLLLLKNRYWELRKNVITIDTINKYLDSYKNTLLDSGAALRDSEKWYENNIEYEIEQIRRWANNRIRFLDQYFK